jgi:hypothetical protein
MDTITITTPVFYEKRDAPKLPWQFIEKHVNEARTLFVNRKFANEDEAVEAHDR